MSIAMSAGFQDSHDFDSYENDHRARSATLPYSESGFAIYRTRETSPCLESQDDQRRVTVQ